MDNLNYKKDALSRLNGNWGKIIGITLIYALICGLIHGLLKAFSGFLVIVDIPLSYGLLMTYYKIYKGEDVKVFDFWNDGFNNFARAWSVSWRVFLKMLIPYIIIVIAIFTLVVSIIALGASDDSLFDNEYYDEFEDDFDNYNRYKNNIYNYKNYYDNNYDDETDYYNYNNSSSQLSYNNQDNVKLTKLSTTIRKNDSSSKSENSPAAILIMVVSIIVIVVCSIWLIPISYSYKFARLIAIENVSMSAKDAVDMSKKIMDGNRMKLFILELSFFGWAILSALTCGIGYLWLQPYMMFASFSFYQHLMEKQTPEAQVVDNGEQQ